VRYITFVDNAKKAKDKFDGWSIKDKIANICTFKYKYICNF
jgi:hypothetical protein